MKPLLLAILMASTPYVQALTDDKIMQAIGLVESGNNPNALGDHYTAFGKYQQHVASWHDANTQLKAEGHRTWPLSSWRSSAAQEAIGYAYLRWLRNRFSSEGIINPTPEQIALAWNLGFDGAKKLSFNPINAPAPRRDAAERVGNLCK